nr:immunoglobulin heavy chain junction region [Macaca mulatta]MOW23144.1 immunoglobulin heavy chain junction region [Macaca mulatta]MOW23258.1 immunoglobulin heavy chain junction region [Macaca mulatta]MOW23511.1 immunoglobulin heavy chain junction region [Macaca mulatta]MOW23568.1 immunoglobulin heavy chain junction region [Macaca mulatta]
CAKGASSSVYWYFDIR